MRFLLRSTFAAGVGALLAACGGKVIFDGSPGAGGAASSTTASSTTASSGMDCSALGAAYQAALTAATACNACVDTQQCFGPQLPDLCQCPITMNTPSGPATVAAQNALAAFQAAGCPFHQCGSDCPNSGPNCATDFTGQCDSICSSN